MPAFLGSGCTTARHADIDVTMTIYAHTNLDEMRQALDAIGWGAG